MVHQLAKLQSHRLLKHVVRCYLRLSDNPRAREALRQCLPEPLRDGTFAAFLREDVSTAVGACMLPHHVLSLTALHCDPPPRRISPRRIFSPPLPRCRRHALYIF